MQQSGPWKNLKSSDQWIYKWDPLKNEILVSNLMYIWGKSYSDTEISSQTPANFKSNSLDQIKDLLTQLLSKSSFTPELSHDLILRGELPLSHFVFTWTFTLPRLDQSQFYQYLTLPLLQILKCSIPFITNESKFYSNLGKSCKNVNALFESSLFITALERLESNASTASTVVEQPQETQNYETQNYEENLKKSLSKKKRKSLFS
jgi:hypothetical protein